MKQFSTLIVCFSLLLVSCGSSSDTAESDEITPGMTIENTAQSAKVCEPFIKYLECSIEKSPEAKRETAQKALDDTKSRIQNYDPARIAQTCETYMQIMRDNPEISFKNGCTLGDETDNTASSETTQAE